MRRWAIEFRSGSFFVNLDAPTGGPASLAMRFRSKRSANRFLRRHEWMLWNGACPLKLGEGQAR